MPDLPEEATFHFAAAFSAGYPQHQEIYAEERDAEAARVEKHWHQVRKQQEEAAALRDEIFALEQKLQPLVQELETVTDAAKLLGCA